MKRPLVAMAVLLVTAAAVAQSTSSTARPRASDLRLKIGILLTGPLDAITDVAGVEVGHTTIIRSDDVRTGVTAILPHPGNLFREKVPGTLLGIWGLGIALAGASVWDEAIEKISRAVDGSSRAPFFLSMLAWCQAASGRQEQARQTLGELERRAATEYVSPIALALALSELGDQEKARTLLGGGPRRAGQHVGAHEFAVLPKAKRRTADGGFSPGLRQGRFFVNRRSRFELPDNVQFLAQPIIFNRGKLEQVRCDSTGGRWINCRGNDLNNNERSLADDH